MSSSHQMGPSRVVGEEVFHTMEGIPFWMAMTGIGVMIVATHFIIHRGSLAAKMGQEYRTFNILNFKPLKQLVKLPGFPMWMQSISVILFFFILSAGLFGSQRNNIAPVLTWTWWWVLLIFIILGFGKAFCSICPWEGVSSILTSLSLNSRVKKIGFELKWPKSLSNIYPAIVLFIALTWYELGFDITRSPSLTAVLGMAMLFLAVLSAIVFEKRGFCRYACLVGRISGLYSMFSPVELRPVSQDVCASCKTKDCNTGGDDHSPCPTSLFPSKLKENTYCTLCTECVRSCPHDNMGVNLRPLGTDLYNKTKFQWDEAIMAVVLLALTSFHGLTMTPMWWKMNDVLRVDWQMGKLFVFSVLMVLMIILPILFFWLAAWVTSKVSSHLDTPKLFVRFCYALIPVALFYHLAHNGMHFFMEAQNILPLLSDPFGWGWNLFGTAGKTYGSLLSLQTIWWLQIFLILAGHVYGVVIADRIAIKIHEGQKYSLKFIMPFMFTMVCYSSFSVWLIAQPMEMRSGM